MNSRPSLSGGNTRHSRGRRTIACVAALAVCLGTVRTSMAAADDPGRLFFTPVQRAQLEAARARNPILSSPGHQVSPDSAPVPLRYDGEVIRSDGTITRWIDGKPQRDGSAVSGLKPGQIRANGKVYEPYQVLRPVPAGAVGPNLKEPGP